jgi:hypothetical protein
MRNWDTLDFEAAGIVLPSLWYRAFGNARLAATSLRRPSISKQEQPESGIARQHALAKFDDEKPKLLHRVWWPDESEITNELRAYDHILSTFHFVIR